MRSTAFLIFAASILSGVIAYGMASHYDPAAYTTDDARIAAQAVFNLFGGFAVFGPILGGIALSEAYSPKMRAARKWERECRQRDRARRRSLETGLRGWEKTLAS